MIINNICYFWVLNFEILLLFSLVVHHGEITVAVDVQKGQLVLDDDRHVDVVGRGSHVLVILLSEDVSSHNHCFSVAVFTSFRGRNWFYLQKSYLEKQQIAQITEYKGFYGLLLF